MTYSFNPKPLKGSNYLELGSVRALIKEQHLLKSYKTHSNC